MAKKINFGPKVIIGQSRFGRLPFISNGNVNMPSVAKILPELSTSPIFNPCTTTPCTPYQMTIYNRPTLHPLSLSLTPNLFRDPGEGNRNIDLWRETSSLPTYFPSFHFASQTLSTKKLENWLSVARRTNRQFLLMGISIYDVHIVGIFLPLSRKIYTHWSSANLLHFLTPLTGRLNLQ